jgi:hypothetical protein
MLLSHRYRTPSPGPALRDARSARRARRLLTLLTAAAIASAVAATGSRHASADAQASQDAAAEIEAPRRGGVNEICGPFDADCRRDIRKILTRLQDKPLTVGQGITFGGDHSNLAMKFHAQFVAMDTTNTEAGLLLFDALYLGDGGMRVRFTFADVEAKFTCNPFDSTPPTIPPRGNKFVRWIIKTLMTECKPEPGSAKSRWGAGGSLMHVQGDWADARLAGRWLEIYGVLSLLANANTEQYLQKRLHLYAGASLDTITHFDSRGTNVIPRGQFGVSGMLRTANNHWEIRGLAGMRSDLSDLDNFSFETRAQALFHVMRHRRDDLIKVGVETQYQYNRDPENSIGEYASTQDKHSAYMGAVLGFYFH